MKTWDNGLICKRKDIYFVLLTKNWLIENGIDNYDLMLNIN